MNSSRDRLGTDWRRRRVLVVGLGRSGLASCRFLLDRGCRVRATELHDTEPLRSTAEQLRGEGVEAVELGGHAEAMLDGCETVVVSPGVPETAAPLVWAQDRDLAILSEVEVAFRFCPAPIIAVTGTNGKSSVVTLIERIMQAARHPVVACGNLGVPFVSVMGRISTGTVVVVEVSSFQLMWCREFRPAIGVLLNLGTNHLDRHHDRASYIAAKAKLFARQTPDDYAVLNGFDPEVVAVGRGLAARRIWVGAGSENPPAFRLAPSTCRLLTENVQAVLQVGRLLGLPDPFIHQAIREFRGLEHRLEPVASIRGVRVINDSKSTTPESLLYALQRCRGPIVPILGGRDKGLDFSLLSEALAQDRIRGIVLIGESRHRIRALFNGHPPVRECQTLADAVDSAMALAHPGDTVLFSPACASFDMFQNFEERGRVFKDLVRQRRGGTA